MFIAKHYLAPGVGKSIDIGEVYGGCNCFLLCPGPSLSVFDLKVLAVPGVVTFGVNNAPITYEDKTGACVDLWVGCDPPNCFMPRILLNPRTMKFGTALHSELPIGNGRDELYCSCPNMYFIELDSNYTEDSFLCDAAKFVWWNDTFTVAVQMCWRLGFRKVFILGSDFKVEKGKEYSHGSSITEQERKSNQRLYSKIVGRMEQLRRCFDSHGFELYNCGGGMLRERGVLPHMELSRAIEHTLACFPKEMDTAQLPHALRAKNGLR